MRIETTKRNLYKWEELNDKAKENAVDELYDINIDFEWWYHFCEDAENIGLKITEWDLGRSNYCHGAFVLSAEEVAANIFRDHGINCETYKTATDFMKKHDPLFAAYLDTEDGEDELLELEQDFLLSLCEDYLVILSKEYEYRISDEAIIETIKANEYEFTGAGKLS